MYVSICGNKMLGGGDRTSYHDIFEAAGFVDMIPGGWPEYAPRCHPQ